LAEKRANHADSGIAAAQQFWRAVVLFLVCGHAPLTQAIWIAVPGFVDHGNVIDIALNTIKAQNFVKSIVRPTSYVSLTNIRRNWRRMTVHLSLSGEKGTHLKPD
jgi:hypothetical protein